MSDTRENEPSSPSSERVDGGRSTQERAAAVGGDREAAPFPDSSPLPGPDALYGPNPTPPQLENADGWRADPLLISGCDAYLDGEYLYQDYIYDDHGADTRPLMGGVPSEAEHLGGLVSQPTGDFHYPNDDERYGYNAADLLEFRARPADDGDAVVYRITLNTMLEPDAAAVAIGVDTDAGANARSDENTDGESDETDKHTDWGYGLGDLGAPVDHRIVTWGTGAELDGEPLDDSRVTVDTQRNQIELTVPLSPRRDTWRHYLVVGLWDEDTHGFKPVERTPDEETPGGQKHSTDAPPVFNVGFRFDEPSQRNVGPIDLGRSLLELFDVTGAGRGILDLFIDTPPRVLGEGNWHEHGQAMALIDRDISAQHADIDFGKLRDGDVDRRIPESGYLSCLYPSRYYLGQGVDPDNDVLQGRIQPYNVYIPENRSEPAPLVLLLHSLGGCYTQYEVYMPNLVEELSESSGAVVLMPQARGPGRWYKREAELDVFEAWRDLEKRYEIDRERVSLAGYSMGGFGTCMLASQCPDLFACGVSIVGPSTEDPIEGMTGGMVRAPPMLTNGLFGGDGGGEFLSVFTEGPESALPITDNLRHVPMLFWNGAGDVLVPVVSPLNYARRLGRHGYRHQIDVFPAETHLSFALRDRWTRIPAFIEAGTVERKPTRVTYRQVPELDHPEVGLVHDGAYWVSDITTRDGEDTGLVDVVSLADGYAEPKPSAFKRAGLSPQCHLSRGVEWERPETGSGAGADAGRSSANALVIGLEGVGTVTLWIEEAGLDPTDDLTIDVESDGDATVRLAGEFGRRTVSVSKGRSTLTVDVEGGGGMVATQTA